MSTVGRAATVTIANGQTVSNAIDLGEMAIVGIQFATMTGTAITFQASADNSTFVIVKKVDGNDYALVITDDHYTVIPPADLCGIRYLKVVSGTSEGAARDIVLMLRSV